MPNNDKAIATASKIVPLIEDLIKNEGYNAYFIPMLEKRTTELENKILNDDMEPEKREILRQRRLELIELKETVGKDFKNNNKILFSER